MRSQSISFFEEEDVDLLWILDADEFYTEDEIRGVIDFVKNRQDCDYYKINMKSYMIDNKHWFNFIPMRVIWRKRFGGIRNYYFDNHYCYNDNSEYRCHKSCDIPKEVVFPLHYSWTQYHNTTGPKNIQDKIEYQKRYYSDGCGFYYDNKEDKIVSHDSNREVFIDAEFNKNIILSPQFCEQPSVIDYGNPWYHGIRLFCGKYESSKRNYIKGIMMGVDSHFVPMSHPLYRSWEDIYKVGVEWYSSQKWNFASVLIYNSPSHIPYILNNYKDIQVKVVIMDEIVLKDRWKEKIERDDILKYRLVDLLKSESDIIRSLGICYDWKYLCSELDIYRNISKEYNVLIYGSFEEALRSIV